MHLPLDAKSARPEYGLQVAKGGGELVVAPADASLTVTLIPFMRGDAGEQGNDGVGIDNFSADPLAIYLISRG